MTKRIVLSTISIILLYNSYILCGPYQNKSHNYAKKSRVNEIYTVLLGGLYNFNKKRVTILDEKYKTYYKLFDTSHLVES